MAISIEDLLQNHGFGAASINLIKDEYEPTENLTDGLIWHKPSTKETKMHIDGEFRMLTSHGTYFTKFTDETLVTERTRKVPVNIPEYKPGMDFIQVAKNGNMLTEGKDYFIDKETKIIHSMREDYVDGDRFAIEIALITTVPFQNNNLFLQLEDHVLVNEGEEVVHFNIPQYLPEYDLLRVHQRNLEIFKDIDWVPGADRQSIKVLYPVRQDDEFHFTVIKQVRGNTQGILIDGTMIVPGTITKESLGFVVDEIDPEILDGIVNEREVRIFEQYKEDIAKDKGNIDTRFSIIHGNIFLQEPVKTNLAMAKTEFDEAYNNYKEIIDRALMDMSIVNDERLEIDERLELYRDELLSMVEAFELALDNISENRWYSAEENMDTRVNNKLKEYIAASVYEQDLDLIKSQLDGNITSWFQPHAPTLGNKPAVDWQTASERNVHLGDLFYDTETGYAYRFATQDGEYKWIMVQDTDVQKALKEAAAAQDTADSKRRVFVVQPIPPYDIGDLWVQGEEGDIMRSIQNKTKSESFNATDWIVASRYTDDSRAIAAEENAKGYAEELANAIGQEISDVSGALSDLNDHIDGAFKDGIISETEERDIRIYVNVLQSQKSDVDNRYTVLAAESDLEGDYRTTLVDAKAAFDAAHLELVQTILSSISDGKATEEERLLVDQMFEVYNQTVSVLSNAFESAVNAVAIKKAKNAEGAAKAHADEIKKGIDNDVLDINTRINGLSTYIDEAFFDSVIDLTERESIRTYLHQIDTEKADVDTRFDSIHTDEDLLDGAPKTELVTAKDEYDQAHLELKIIIIAAIDDSETNETESAQVNAGFTVYRTKLSVLSLKMKKATDAIMLKRAKDAEERAVERANGELVNYVSLSAFTADLEKIREQIDGSITSWFYPHEPTMTNLPASNWPTSVRNGKLGDLFYNTVTGYAYRFALEDEQYKWIRVQDTDVQKALRDASAAQDTADNKRRVFVVQPKPPYDAGDLWSDGPQIFKALYTVPATDAFSMSHWERVGDVTDQNTSADTNKVNGVPATEISDAAVNFNTRNDRIATTPLTPEVLTNLTAVDHILNTDGSADVSFEWEFEGNGEAADIDGFFVYIYSSKNAGTYLFGTNPAAETIYPVSSEKRSFIAYGVPADHYYTFGIQAYREVDQDIAPNGLVKSAIRKASAISENPYRPSQSVAFSGDVKGTIDGTPAADMETKDGSKEQADRAIDEAQGYTDQLRNQLLITRTENWLRHFFNSPVLASGTPTENAFGAPRGALFVGVQNGEVIPALDMASAAHLLRAFVKSYKEINNPAALNNATYMANFILTKTVEGYFHGTSITVVPAAYEYDESLNAYEISDSDVPLRLMYEMAGALMDAFNLTSDVRYRDRAGDLMDTLAMLAREVNQEVDASAQLAEYMLGAQYAKLTTGDNQNYVTETNVFSNTLSDAIRYAVESFPEDMLVRTAKSGNTYTVTSLMNNYDAYIETIHTAGYLIREGNLPVLNEFMFYSWSDDMSSGGRYLPYSANMAIDGGFETTGLIHPAEQAKAIAGISLSGYAFAAPALEGLLQLRVPNRGNDILFFSSYADTGVPAPGAELDLRVTAALFAGRYYSDIKEDAAAFIQTLKSNQIRTFDRKMDGALYQNPDSQQQTSSAVLAYAATTPVNEVPVPGGLDSIFTDIQRATYGLDAKINELDTYVETAFQDGVISEMEARSIQMYLNQIDNEKAAMDARYDQLIELGIQDLAVESSLTTAKAVYDNAYNSLRNKITVSIGDRDITETEKAEVDQAFVVYRESIGTMQTAMEIYVAKQADEKAGGALTDAKQYTSNLLVDYVNKQMYGADLDEIRKQIDGNITTWFENHDPSMENEPAADWITTELKNQHLGDIFYNTETGHAYRFALVNSVYDWIQVQDSDIQEALKRASDAQDTADGKRRTFVVQPIPPYDPGDLWVQGTGGDILSAIVKKDAGQNFSSADWTLASKYTDDARAIEAESNAKTYADNMKLAIDQEIKDLNDALLDFEGVLGDSFVDAIVTEAEAKAIQTHIQILDNEKEDVDSRFSRVHANTHLSAETKTKLSDLKVAYDAGHTNLVAMINAVIADSAILQSERDSVDAEFTAYRTALATLSGELETAVDEIATKKAADAESSAVTHANNLKLDIDQDIKDVDGRITDFDEYVEGAFKDGVVNQAEAFAIATHIEQLKNEKTDVDKRYENIHANTNLSGTLKADLSSVKSSWDNAHSTLVTSIQNAIVDPKITAAEKAAIDSNFTTYRARTATLAARLETAVDSIMNQKAIDASTDAKNYADLMKIGINSELNDISSTFNGFKGEVEGAFRDGIVEESEAKSIENYLNNLRAEKRDFDERYNTLFANEDLVDPERAALAAAKSAFDSAQSSLVATVNVAIVDGRATTAERHNVNVKFEEYTTALGALTIRLEEAINSVAAKKSADAEEAAKKHADDLKLAIDQDVSEVDGRVNTLDTYIDGAFQDKVLTKAEKMTIRSYIEQINKENDDLEQQYETLYADVHLTGEAKTNLYNRETAYGLAYANLLDAIDGALTDDTLTTAERDAVDAGFTSYRPALAEFSSALMIAVNAIAQTKAYNAEYNAKQYTDGLLDDYVSSTFFEESIAEIQRQADGGIMTWFYNYAPTLTNAPAVEWTTTEDKNVHLGDLFYDTETGYAYRYGVDNSVYKWIRIQDSDVEAALKRASDAQDTADSKRRTFVNRPVTPYEIGDLWVQGASGDILKAKVNKTAAQAYSSADWEKAGKYTDDTRAVDAEKNAKLYADNLKSDLVDEIGDVTTSIGNLDSFVKGSFKDGIVSETEAKAISVYVNTLQTEKSDVDSRYSAVINNADLSGAPKTAATSAKTAYNSAHSALISAITTAIADGAATIAERDNVDSKFAAYRIKLADLGRTLEAAIDAIAAKKANDAESAAAGALQTYSQAVTQDLADVNKRVTDFDTYVNEAFRDGVINEAEAKVILSHIEQLTNEKADVDNRYTKIYEDKYLGTSEKAAFKAVKDSYDYRHGELITELNFSTQDNHVTVEDQAYIEAAFQEYRDEIAQLAIAFENAIQAIADKRAEAVKEYVQSRGENLVTNGTGLLGDNTNFSSFTFDGAQAFAGAGSFHTAAQNSTLFNDELIPVDPSKRYRGILMAKSKTGLGHNYFGFSPYDIDRLNISSPMIIAHQYPVVTLAQDLKKGDTVIHLSSTDGFVDNQGDASHNHSMALWGYKNSFGYEYPPSTYTRFIFSYGWDNGAIDYTNKTITLRKPFDVTNTNDPLGVFRAGHAVSRTTHGSGYLYTMGSNVKATTEWTKFEGELEGFGRSNGKFPYGTAFVNLLFLVNRNTSGGQAGDELWVNSLEFVNLDAEDRSKSYTDAIKSDLDEEIGDITTALSDFQGTVEGSFRDGVISQAEMKAIGSYINIIDSEKLDVTSRYNSLNGNAKLSGTAKTNLTSANGVYNNAHASLISSITTAIAGTTVTDAQKNDVNSKFTTYRNALSALSARFEEAIDFISSKKATDVQEAIEEDMSTWQQSINQDFIDVNKRVTDFDTYVEGAFKDGLISSAEAKSIGTQKEQLNNEKGDLDNRYSAVYADASLTGSAAKTNLHNAKVAYNSSHSGLITRITSIVTAGAVTTTDQTAIANLFADYRAKLKTLSTRFEEAIIAITSKKAADAEANANIYTDNKLNNYVTATGLADTLDQIQSQIDGSITNWFYSYAPTLTNEPAVSWNTATLKNTHLGDIFYNNETGYAYRFSLSGTTYSWIRIKDSDVEAAMTAASNAQDTADNKRRVFVNQPTAPYDVGDLWVQGAAGDILRCTTARGVGASFSLSHWTKAAKYTDDARAIEAEREAIAAAGTLAATAAATAQTNAEITADGYVSDAELRLLQVDADNLKAALLSDKVQDFGSSFKVFRNVTGFNQGGSNYTGAILIQTPITFTAKMTRIDIAGFNYRGSENEIDLSVAFYAYNSTSNFVNHGFTDSGTFRIPKVYLTNIGGKVAVILGDANTVWQYPKVMVERAIISQSTVTDSWAEGWSTSFVTDLSGYDLTTVAGRRMEDETGAQTKVNTLQTTINATHKVMDDAIVAKVEKKDIYSYYANTMRIRYIRDSMAGSTANSGNHWVEIQAYAAGQNVAYEKPASGSSSSVDYSRITDGSTDSSAYVSGSSYVQVDLGEVRTDLEYLRIWHYYGDSRTYHETKTEVSENGTDWFTVFDSAVTGEYPETLDGNLIPINQGQFFAEYQEQMKEVSNRVSKAEEIIKEDNISQLVLTHSSFKSAMDDKANADDLSGYAPTGAVDELTGRIQSLEGALEFIQNGDFVTGTQLTNNTNAIVANILAGGGVNLLLNSTGYSQNDWWKIVGTSSLIRSTTSNTLDGLKHGFGFRIIPNGGTTSTKLSQTTRLEARKTYTLSFSLDKEAATTLGEVKYRVIDEDSGIVLEEGIFESNTSVSVDEDNRPGFTFKTESAQNIIEFEFSANVDATLSGIMLNVGEYALQWTMANGELHNNNVRIDMRGLSVSQDLPDQPLSVMEMTNANFAGYYDIDNNGFIDRTKGSVDEVFRMDKDEFVMKKAVVKEEITMGSMRILNMDLQGRTGWAFVGN